MKYTFLVVVILIELLYLPGIVAVRGPYEDVGTGLPRKHDFTRSESGNWRTSRDDQNGEDDEGGWHLAGFRWDNDRWCPPSPGGPCRNLPTYTFISEESFLINVLVCSDMFYI